MAEKVWSEIEQLLLKTVPQVAGVYYWITLQKECGEGLALLKNALRAKWPCGVVLLGEELRSPMPTWLSSLHRWGGEAKTPQLSDKEEQRLSALRDKTRGVFCLLKQATSTTTAPLTKSIVVAGKVSGGPQSRREVADLLMGLGSEFPHAFGVAWFKTNFLVNNEDEVEFEFEAEGEGKQRATEQCYIRYPAKLDPRFKEMLQSHGYLDSARSYWAESYDGPGSGAIYGAPLRLTAARGVERLRKCIQEAFLGYVLREREDVPEPTFEVEEAEAKDDDRYHGERPARLASDEKLGGNEKKALYEFCIDYPSHLAPLGFMKTLQDGGFYGGASHFASRGSDRRRTVPLNLDSVSEVDDLQRYLCTAFPDHGLHVRVHHEASGYVTLVVETQAKAEIEDKAQS